MKSLNLSLKAILLLFLVIVLSSCSSSGSDETISHLDAPSDEFIDVNYSYTAFEREVLNAVNEARLDEGLNALNILNLASQEALGHNEHMMENEEVCHHNFSERRFTIKDAMDATGVGENIAYGEADAETIVQAWLDSEAHRDNMLREDYTHFGISITPEDEDTFYFTNIFVIE